MKNIYIIFLIAAAAALAILFFARKSMAPTVSLQSSVRTDDGSGARNSSGNEAVSQPDMNITKDGFQPPLDRAKERVTKKPFGIFINSQNSPVKPEKFRGYHTGTDLKFFRKKKISKFRCAPSATGSC